MKIKSLQISNILSFKYYEDFSQATTVIFDENLNIIIGENGAGKSTVLEVLNFIFKRILFTQYNINQELYLKRNDHTIPQRKSILGHANNTTTYKGFRLDPNWNTEDKPRKIRIIIELDQIDHQNIESLIKYQKNIKDIASLYSNEFIDLNSAISKEYVVDVTLNKADQSFSKQISPNDADPGYKYLAYYNFYRELISFYNLENPNTPIPSLYESFALIGGYRNYFAFTPAVSLQSAHAVQQIQQIRTQEYAKSLHASEQSEPAIFNLVRLRVAEKHFDIYGTSLDKNECEIQVNGLPFLMDINRKLKLISLECKIRLQDQRTWQYSFEILDTRRGKVLADINHLSAGQKAIIHLVFEAYGRGELKGGLVIIDEPEIHLHYQFQNEYMRVIKDISQENNCQYIIVTHSESLINSDTIHKIKRFALDENNNTVIKAPILSTEQKLLVKILDNARTTYAFFARKVVLVEGEDDRYFFKAAFQHLIPAKDQEISILDIGGKGNFEKWQAFFESFGLKVYFIGDLDAAFQFLYTNENAYKLNSPELIIKFRTDHPDLITQIENKYSERIYILKSGVLEQYLGVHNKGLTEIIKFCNEGLSAFMDDAMKEETIEMKSIITKIAE